MSLILLLKCGPDAESGRVIRLLQEGYPVVEGGSASTPLVGLRLWSAYAFGRLTPLVGFYAFGRLTPWISTVSHTHCRCKGISYSRHRT